jgi:hypothetical protein
MRPLVALLLLPLSAAAADLKQIDRTIAKEPKYTGKPGYCLLVFGAEAKHRVWLVQDGDALYVDRNGNGDLTEAGEKVTAPKPQPGDTAGAFGFEVDDVTVGGRTHKGLKVRLVPLRALADNPNLMQMPTVAVAVRKSPDAATAMIDVDVECQSLTGGGVGGRVSYLLSLFDADGVLQLADKPADAPVIWLDGPLQVTFYGGRPTWRGGRSQDTILCVGTPGVGPGMFAMAKYEGLVPPGKHPTADVRFAPKDPAKAPVKELFELPERC